MPLRNSTVPSGVRPSRIHVSFKKKFFQGSSAFHTRLQPGRRGPESPGLAPTHPRVCRPLPGYRAGLHPGWSFHPPTLLPRLLRPVRGCGLGGGILAHPAAVVAPAPTADQCSPKGYRLAIAAVHLHPAGSADLRNQAARFTPTHFPLPFSPYEQPGGKVT